MAAVAAALPYITAAATAASTINSIVQSRRQAAAGSEAAQQAAQQAKTQQAIQNRTTIATEQQSATLDGQSAQMQAITAANRRNRGGMQYTGFNPGLKTTFGG